jgi:hypothetical protein
MKIITAATNTICQPDTIWKANRAAANPELIQPPKLYIPWQVLIILLPYFFSMIFTVALEETPFRKLISPKQYRQSHSITLLTELISAIMIKQSVVYPKYIQVPTGMRLNTLVLSATPVSAPKGDNNRESPRLQSVNPILSLTVGIAATQVPNKRLEVQKLKPTASAGLIFMKEEIFRKKIGTVLFVKSQFKIDHHQCHNHQGSIGENDHPVIYINGIDDPQYFTGNCNNEHHQGNIFR